MTEIYNHVDKSDKLLIVLWVGEFDLVHHIRVLEKINKCSLSSLIGDWVKSLLPQRSQSD